MAERAQRMENIQGETVVEMNDHGGFLLSTPAAGKGLRPGGGKLLVI